MDKEFHIWLYDGYPEYTIHDYEKTFESIRFRVPVIHTTQIALCNQSLFEKGYRIIVHSPYWEDNVELLLGDNCGDGDHYGVRIITPTTDIPEFLLDDDAEALTLQEDVDTADYKKATVWLMSSHYKRPSHGYIADLSEIFIDIYNRIHLLNSPYGDDVTLYLFGIDEEYDWGNRDPETGRRRVISRHLETPDITTSDGLKDLYLTYETFFVTTDDLIHQYGCDVRGDKITVDHVDCCDTE